MHYLSRRLKQSRTNNGNACTAVPNGRVYSVSGAAPKDSKRDGQADVINRFDDGV
jgi:hypothetical protein